VAVAGGGWRTQDQDPSHHRATHPVRVRVRVRVRAGSDRSGPQSAVPSYLLSLIGDSQLPERGASALSSLLRVHGKGKEI
jgi:hypothetical protein